MHRDVHAGHHLAVAASPAPRGDGPEAELQDARGEAEEPAVGVDVAEAGQDE
ncbi:hypothetical protein [Streptomyces sp. WG7]|uniref:hypothetical protein n=1 Tax=Streptomyces sp. WG7 TaxID=3417650 RepID=UPI003CF5E05C